MNPEYREPLRPEDAASWEEFQARSIMEQRRCYADYRPKVKAALMLLSLPCGLAALICGIAGSVAVRSSSWSAAPAAFAGMLIFIALLLWTSGHLSWPPIAGSRRYKELSRLCRQWRARAERGEIPPTTSGEPEVWRA